MVVWATTQAATWSYVEQAWGGITLAEVKCAPDGTELRFKLFVHDVTRIDSAITVRRTVARVEEGRILVRLDRCICDGSLPEDTLSASLPPLPSGHYDLVYDDEAAGFPKFGELRL